MRGRQIKGISGGIPFFGVLGIIAALVGCRNAPNQALTNFRFIDHLSASGIADGPWRTFDAGIHHDDQSFPVKSTPLIKSSIGSEILGVKRKLDLGGREIEILFAPGRSEYQFPWPSRPAGFLDFGIGIIRDAHSIALQENSTAPEAGIGFLIILESEERKKVIFEQHLALPPANEARTVNFSQRRIAMPSLDKPAILTFLTTGREGCFSFWQNPVFFIPDSRCSNVVLVSIDTLRPDHLGAYGYSQRTSPALDELAAEGVVFLNAYTTAPWTLPSHVSMLTGLNCVRHRVYRGDDILNEKIPTLAEKLRDKGYACEAVTGGGFVSAIYGFSRGFESYRMDQGGMLYSRQAGEAAKAALEWLDFNKSRPFFLFVHTYQVHSPYQAPDHYPDHFVAPSSRWKSFDIIADLGGLAGTYKALPASERANVIGLYDAEIRYTDDVLIKPLLDKLKTIGVYDRTLIIVTSDHGEMFFEHGAWGHSNSLYDEVLRVPLIVKMPRSKFRGKRLVPIVRITDVPPTVLDVLDIPFDASAMDGASLWPVITEKELNDRTFLAELAADAINQIPQRICLNHKRMKFILNEPFSQSQKELFSFPPVIPAPLELYDLTSDPTEKNSLVEAPGQEASIRPLLHRALEIAQLIPPKNESRGRISDDLKMKLKALGYLR